MTSEQPPKETDESIDGDHQLPDEEFAVDRLKVRVNESLNKRPLTVYLVLFAGAATLLLLLGVVWISSRSNDDQQEPICTEIAPADARAAILAGQIERINILVDSEQPTETLTGIQLRFADGACRQTPQGADLRESLFSIIGAVALYNHYGEGGVDIQYQAQNIDPVLLASSTSTAAPTVEPTVTPTQPDPTGTPTQPDPTETPIPPSSTPTSPVRSPTFEPTNNVTVAPASSGSPEQRAPVGDPGT